VFLGNFEHTFVLEKWRSRTAERTVRGDVDAFVFAEINHFLLWEQRVVFNLVHSGRDGCLCEEFLHIFDRVVCDANGFDFVWVRLNQLLEVLPCLDVCDAVVDVAGAVFEFGEKGVVSCHMSVHVIHICGKKM
jgi:hypothetical protein